jgi:hypothetical protein
MTLLTLLLAYEEAIWKPFSARWARYPAQLRLAWYSGSPSNSPMATPLSGRRCRLRPEDWKHSALVVGTEVKEAARAMMPSNVRPSAKERISEASHACPGKRARHSAIALNPLRSGHTRAQPSSGQSARRHRSRYLVSNGGAAASQEIDRAILLPSASSLTDVHVQQPRCCRGDDIDRLFARNCGHEGLP